MDAPLKQPGKPRQTRSLARSLMLRISMVVALCLLVLGSAIQFLILKPAINAVADGELSRAMTRVEDALISDFDQVAALLATAREWGRRGSLELDRVDDFNALLIPLVRNNAQISSVLFASADGGEILLLRSAEGWHNRLTRPAGAGGGARLQTRSDDGTLLEESSGDGNYDPRTRPWFVGAMGLSADGELHLTQPYRFYTTGDPGMTVSTRWTADDGKRYILAFDILLSDLSRLTLVQRIGEVGGAAVIAAGDRVLGLPRDPSFADPDMVRKAVLLPVGELSVAYLNAGHARWSALGRPSGRTFEFRSGDQNWVGHFRPLGGDEREMWVGGFARSSDFVPARLSDAALFGLLFVAVGLVGAAMASGLARRIGESLRELGEQSERIGRLDLQPGPRVHAPWTEIERLARTQERMRGQLEAAADEISLVQDGTIAALAQLAETRDGETGRHLRRTQAYVRCLAEALRDHPRFRSELTPHGIETLVKSAPLHDIGKVGVPDRVLLKPGKLDREEFALMQQHTTLGRDAIEHAERSIGASAPFLKIAKEVAYSHQEKWDGSGYPQGIAGDTIPVSARLMAVADVYDALISRRIYKQPHSHEEAVEFIRAASGSHFDPDVVDAFCKLEGRFREIATGNADTPADLESQRRHLEVVFGAAMPAADQAAAEAQTPLRR